MNEVLYMKGTMDQMWLFPVNEVLIYEINDGPNKTFINYVSYDN